MFQFTEFHEWIPQFGVSYALGVDGIALVLIALATVLTPVCILASWHDVEQSAVGESRRSVKGYFALLLLLETFMVGVFAATDVFLFYVLFEAMLVPMYFIIGSYGGAQRSYAAVKFLLYSLVGGLLMLAAVIGLYVNSVRRLEGVPVREPAGHRARAPAPSGCCSSASSSRSPSRRRCGRCTPGCRTPRPRRRPAVPCCWSASWTRSAPSA